MSTYKKWTEEEWNTFYELLRTNTVKEAARIHAANTGRNTNTIVSKFYAKKKKGGIPSEILDSVPSSVCAWTDQEEKELLKLIESHPNNFEEAYRIHAENYGRTPAAVKQYFSSYRKDQDAKVCMLSIGGRKRNSPNRKIIHARTGGTVEPIRKSKWRRILEIIFE